MDVTFESLPLQAADADELNRVPDTLRMCPDLHAVAPKICGVYDGWALSLECLGDGCCHKWYVCSICKTSRKRLYTKVQLENHKKNVHKRKSGRKRKTASTADQVHCAPKEGKVEGLKHKKNSLQQVSSSDRDSLLAKLENLCSVKSLNETQRKVLLEKLAALKGMAIDEHKGRLSELILASEATFVQQIDTDDEEDQRHEFTLQNEGDSFVDESETFDILCWVLGTKHATLKNLTKNEKIGFEDAKSERYFANCSFRSENENGNEAGMSYLVLQSYLQREVAPEELFRLRPELQKSHIRLQMLIAKQVLATPRTKIEEFAEMLAGTYAIGCEDGYANAIDVINENFNAAYPTSTLGENIIAKKIAPNYEPLLVSRSAHKFSPRIPTTCHDIRVHYTSNKFSILENLPVPHIHTDIEGHAYVSIIECIRDNFAHSACRVKNIEPVSENSNGIVDALWKCNKAQRMYAIHKATLTNMNKDGLVFYLIFWSDDCDPNSAAMQGRANVWVKSMTIAQPSDDKNRTENTYPIAFGEKGMSHNQVELKINEELAQLCSGMLDPFYIGRLNKKVNCTFGVLASIPDQPERRSANFLQMGNSTYHTRCFVSANSLSLYTQGRLQSCTNCREKLITRFQERLWTEPIEPCKECLNWDVLQEGTDCALYQVPDGYPDIHKFINPADSRLVTDEDGRRYLQCFRITYGGLRRAIRTAHRCYIEKGWTKKECKCFLSVEGINDAFITMFQLHADRAKVLNNAQGMQLEELQDDYAHNPHLYSMIPFPAQWVRPGQELSDTIDALMHLVFLGVVKTCMGKVQKCLELKGKNAVFVFASQRILKSLLAMNIDWMKLRSYEGGKFYGWNSENYVAIARILPWFYQNISVQLDATDPHRDAPPDNKPHTQWTAAENRYWLKIRDLDSSGKQADLIARVADYMSQDTVPQPVPIKQIRGSNIQQMLLSLFTMVQCFMARCVDKELIQKTEYAIRIFLSAYNAVDNLTRKDGSKPSVISAYNFLCLLNTPKAMSEFGPLRELWEGKIQGEGGLVFIKPQMTQGMRKNWQANLLNNVLREKALQNITGDLKEKDLPTVFSRNYLRHHCKQFQKYQSVLQVIDSMQQLESGKKSALSVLLVKKGAAIRLFAAVHDYNTVTEIVGPLNLHATKSKFGWNYYSFEIANDGELLDWVDNVGRSFEGGGYVSVGYGVLLPLLETEAVEANRLFALVSSNWNVLAEDIEMEALVPTIS